MNTTIKLNYDDLAEIIETEGLGTTLLTLVDPEDIEDKSLAYKWFEAKNIVDNIVSTLRIKCKNTSL